MNSHTDRSLRDGGEGNDSEQLLDQLLTHHRIHLSSAVADALDIHTGSTALAPLRRELFHGLKPLELGASAGPTAKDSTAESAAPIQAARLEEVLTRLRGIKLIAERVCACTDPSAAVHARAQAVVTVLQKLHSGLQERHLTRGQAHVLFRQLSEETARIATTMLHLRTQLPQHVVEEWLRRTGSLGHVERSVYRLFKNVDDNVPTQH
ncbi:hypothetical protein [Streptomyces bottropensis]|uniref:hypothetical protein n=1 Tax=Streptomyces bottropensis TaxID=42235 RepID=UPI0036A8A7DA